jgi:hypothetical protein
VGKIGAGLRELLFIVRDCGYDFRSFRAERRDSADFDRAPNLGAGRVYFLWRLRHNTG